ncbi:MAG TPA: proton-conducting transporter membrane subunit, partial [Negativicutes bacterium]|nr:proton-conducting transporter membrane subunit [Negativicutes bacterium]
MYELTVLALILPLLTAAASLATRQAGLLKAVNVTGSLLTCGVVFTLVARVLREGPFADGWLYVDALSALLLVVVGFLTFTATLFSASYMDAEVAEGHVRPGLLPGYYALLQLFAFTMLAVLVVENLGLMWVGVEATTLASTLLVAFYFNRSALEAAWKYVMVCNVGILFALLGTILLYYAQLNAGGVGAPLSRTALAAAASWLDPFLVKLAFVFILIGYGTKAGLAPMHTWLPDAHSQAPSPVSGLLSGALLSCALYVLIRNLGIITPVLGGGFVQAGLLLFGMLSVAVAVPFILVQQDIKRLLAYSSVEHVGIVSIGLGIGTPLALYGAAFHILNHAVAKSALFYLAGVISQRYRTKHMMRIRGMLAAMPAVGTMFLVAVLAIVGTPPLNVFFSKFAIVAAAFSAGRPVLGAVL